MAPDSEWVTIAAIGKPRGNRGELQAVSLSDSPGRFESLQRTYLFREDAKLGEFELERAWWHGEKLVLKFLGVDSISEADVLANSEMRVPFVERAPLKPGAYFQSDLIGCELIDQKTGEPLGRVTGWEELAGSLLMEIDEDWLVPFTPALCKSVDVTERRIAVDLPEGLKELNRP